MPQRCPLIPTLFVFGYRGEECSSQLTDWGHHIMLQGSQVLLNGVSKPSCYKSQQGSDSVVPQHRPWGDLSVLLHVDTLLQRLN